MSGAAFLCVVFAIVAVIHVLFPADTEVTWPRVFAILAVGLAGQALVDRLRR